ncbi:hypothetical protein [Rhodococcus zopfii]|uniref:hypothetical protein n=1 Tax=Rhodococcus zopfii TaxID=43772 RepID=UPI00352968BB
MLRRLVGALAVVSVVAVTATVVAVASGLQANSQRAEAQSARDEAMSRQIATVSAQLRNVDPALASQLAVAELPAAADGELYSLEFGPGETGWPSAARAVDGCGTCAMRRLRGSCPSWRTRIG